MSKSQILSNEDELKRTQEKSMKQIQTNIIDFVSNAGRADELAAFFEECHIFGDSRLYRWDPVFRTYERRDF